MVYRSRTGIQNFNMLSKEEEREQKIQEGVDTFIKVVARVKGLSSKIGEIDPETLAFLAQDVKSLPSLSDIMDACPAIYQNNALIHNVVELYHIFDCTSDIIPRSVRENHYVCGMLKAQIPHILSEVRASLLDVTSVSEISTSTLDTTLGTNSSVSHGSSEYCE